MSQLKDQLRLMIPKLSSQANQLKNPEARSRWMRIRSISLSAKSVTKACEATGCSLDFYSKWGKRLLKARSLRGLVAKSRKPHRSPNKTKPRTEKLVLKIRRVEPYLGPERIAMELKRLYEVVVAPSTIFAILRRAGLVGRKLAGQLTKKHLKRYRRPLPGYLQMDFKYVPYLISGKKYYQLSCVDHHSSWRLIRCYRNKNIEAVESFLEDLEVHCPFPIIEIQTDNDTAFTDKFSSGQGVTGEHAMDVWCRFKEVRHRLIPVGVKELNGKIENCHKQDDREFYAIGNYVTFENLALNITGYSDRWNTQRATKALGEKTPHQAIEEAYVRILAWAMVINKVPLQPQVPPEKPKNRTRQPGLVKRYLMYLEWEQKKKLPALFITPAISQNFSVTLFHLWEGVEIGA